MFTSLKLQPRCCPRKDVECVFIWAVGVTKRRGNPNQLCQGQLLHHNYNKVSACRIHTCGTSNGSRLINLWLFLPAAAALLFSRMFDVNWSSRRCSISEIRFNMAKRNVHSEMIPHSKRFGGKREKKGIKLLVSQLCLTVTDNSNYCRFRLRSLLRPFPAGEKEHNYSVHGNNHFTLFPHSLNCLAC